MEPLDWLRRLGAGVRPPGVRGPGPARAFESMAFESLLAGLGPGSWTGRVATASPDVGIELSEDDLARLGAVGDAAEAAGIGRVLVFAPGGLAALDVASRRVERAAPSAAGLVVRGVEAAVLLGPGGADDAGARVVDAASLTGTWDAGGRGPAPGLGAVRNPGLAEALDRRAPDAAGAGSEG